MFQTIEAAPPDAILGLKEAFLTDNNPQKVNLSVGQYQDADGHTPILQCVKEAERRLLENESTKGYLGIVGHLEYDQLVPQLLLGNNHPAIAENRVCTMQTPGGTGALRVAGDFIHTAFPSATVWLSSPTWANHGNIFAAAGVKTDAYAYYDAANQCLDFDALRDDIRKMPAGDVMLLHGCCHNPTGVDIEGDQWRKVGELLKQQGVMPLVDFAYQGFAEGVEPDAIGVRALSEVVGDLMICSSYSKNFGLYRERVGALTLVAPDQATSAAITSRVKKCIRANYSNPPSHGASIVATVLSDDKLRTKWEEELAAMRYRIKLVREEFVSTMADLNSPRDFSFINSQRGMFSYSGLNADQVAQIRDEHSIYIVGSGRINVAGLDQSNIEYVCKAILSVL